MKTKNLIENNLKKFVVKKRAYLEFTKGKKVLLKDVIRDLSDYCGFESFDTINMIYRGINNPSLYTALKIAEYFETNVENIFSLKGEEY